MKELMKKVKSKLPPSYGLYLLMLVCVYLLVFEEVLRGQNVLLSPVLRTFLPFTAVFYFLIRASRNPKHFSKLTSPWVILAALFLICGFIGYLFHRYQTLFVTAGGMYEHIRFWLCLYLAIEFFQAFPLARYARRLFIHLSLMSALILLASYLDLRYNLWPRQIWRFGIGSLQLAFGHPSNLGGACVFLIAMLLILHPMLRTKDGSFSILCGINTLFTFGLLAVVVLTLRFRLLAFAALFVVLYFWMIILNKRLNIIVIAICAAAAFAVGWKRFYIYYFSPFAYTMARGQFAVNSIRIANRFAPFGSGFGTFGSRFAQVYYSPLYYQYDMMLTPGVSPEHPNFTCDGFFPSILAESGWLGFAAYLGLLLLLAVMIYRLQKNSAGSRLLAYASFTAVILFCYELLETTGTLAFSEIYSVMISLALGAALSLRKSS